MTACFACGRVGFCFCLDWRTSFSWTGAQQSRAPIGRGHFSPLRGFSVSYGVEHRTWCWNFRLAKGLHRRAKSGRRRCVHLGRGLAAFAVLAESDCFCFLNMSGLSCRGFSELQPVAEGGSDFCLPPRRSGSCNSCGWVLSMWPGAGQAGSNRWCASLVTFWNQLLPLRDHLESMCG